MDYTFDNGRFSIDRSGCLMLWGGPATTEQQVEALRILSQEFNALRDRLQCVESELIYEKELAEALESKAEELEEDKADQESELEDLRFCNGVYRAALKRIAALTAEEATDDPAAMWRNFDNLDSALGIADNALEQTE